MLFRNINQFLLLGSFAVSSHAASDVVSIAINDTIRPAMNVNSYLELRTQNVVMQHYDYSCGAAALATLMNYYFADSTSEKSLLEIGKNLPGMDKQQLSEKGLSLLDLKKIAEHKGYRTTGVRLKLNQIKKLGGPVIIYYEPNEYPHFAVLKGLKNDVVFLADPSRGNVKDTVYQFAKEWNGIVLALDKSSTQISNKLSPFESEFSVKSRIVNSLK